MSDLDKAIRDLIDDESERAEVRRLIDHHAPGLDDLDREDLVNDLMQLFRPDGPGCWAEDGADESTPGVSGEDRSEPTPAPRPWKRGDKAAWRGRVVDVISVTSDGKKVAIDDHGEVLFDRDTTELSEVVSPKDTP